MALPVDALMRLKVLAVDSPELAHTFSFLTGAVYALREAHARGHRDRADYGEGDRLGHLSRVETVIDAMSGDCQPEGVWVAGFYYNAAIMRIDACYERLLKAVLAASGVRLTKSGRSQSKTNAWASQLEKVLGLGSPIRRDHLEWARGQVNKLKHDLFGRVAAGGHAIDVPHAEAAVSELIELMERAEIRSRLSKRFAGLPPR
jgi:hypothetical protein